MTIFTERAAYFFVIIFISGRMHTKTNLIDFNPLQ